VAIVSGVLDSLAHPNTPQDAASATSTPSSSMAALDLSSESLPSAFIACVAREESVRKLKKLWKDQGDRVEVAADANVKSVARADVVLLWQVLRFDLREDLTVSQL
jgi:pyrroline-5-carboxylate reductase